MYRKVFSFLLTLALMLTTLGVTPLSVQAAATEPTDNAIYYIKNKNSGLYLQVENNSATSGANVIQSSGTGALGQRWIAKANQDGSFRLHPATDLTGNLSLDVVNGSNAAGTNIRIWASNGATAQNLKFSPNADGSYAILTASSNFNGCLDVSGASTASGANVLQWTDKRSSNQSWYFEAAPWPNSSDSSSGSSSDSSTSELTAGLNIQADFPMQQMYLTSTSNGQNLSASGTGNNVSLNTTSGNATANTKWRIVKGNGDYYKIIHVATGKLLSTSGNSTTSNANAVLYDDKGYKAQHWQIVATKTDANGNPLNFKIVNYGNNNMALTLLNNTLQLTGYTGSSAQNWRLNCDGLEGFGGYSTDMNGREKASTIGGLLGDTVYVNSLSGLTKYASGTTPYTIVITSDLSASSLTIINIGKNKTIVGSFSKHTFNNLYLNCTSNSGNVILKNLTIKHDETINANNDIPLYITNGTNFWIDHCSVLGHDLTQNTALHAKDVDKLMYVGVDADYVTVSGNLFTGHKYGLILGYPNDDAIGATYTGYPRMTLCNNYFYNVLTRAPGLMRYGYFHSYNNFVYDFNLGYTPYTNVTIYSENNYFDKGNHTGAVVDDYGVGHFTDSGSVLSYNISNLKTPACSWRPSSNYSYNLLSPSSAKSFAQNYAGSQTSASKISYTNYASAGIPSANFISK